MAISVVTEYTNLDKFFFYFFLPAIAALTVAGNRYYFKSKKPQASTFGITKEIIFGDLIVILLVILVILFLYFYVLELDLFKSARWEMLTLISFIFLTFFIGAGVGAHVAAVSIRKLFDPAIKNGQEIARAINFFHYPFSHQLLFIPGLLAFYLISLLDLFKGRSLELHLYQIIMIILCGFVLGSIAGILFIVTKCNKFILPALAVLTISLIFVSLSEVRSLLIHPVAFLLTTAYMTSTIGILIYKQTRVNFRPRVKRWVKKWWQWDIDYL